MAHIVDILEVVVATLGKIVDVIIKKMMMKNKKKKKKKKKKRKKNVAYLIITDMEATLRINTSR